MQTDRGTNGSNLGAAVRHQVWCTFRVGSGDGSKGAEGKQSGGSVRNTRRLLEGVATGGKAQEGTSKETVGDLGEIGEVDVQVWDPTGRTHMGNNGPHTERDGGIPGYWNC